MRTNTRKIEPTDGPVDQLEMGDRTRNGVVTETSVDSDDVVETKEQLYYTVDANLGIVNSLLFGFQQVMVTASGVVVAPLIVAGLICAADVGWVRVQLVNTMLFMAGLSTILQTTIGIRIPVLQGASFAFIPTIIVFSDQFPCPAAAPAANATCGVFRNESCPVDVTSTTPKPLHMFSKDSSEPDEISGSLAVASVFQISIGAFGLIGQVTKHIGPLTIAPLMLCLELSITRVCLEDMSKSWMSLVMAGTLLITAIYLNGVKVPLPTCSRKPGEPRFKGQPVFALFPYLIGIILVWSLCAILTVTDVLPEGDAARTDLRIQVLTDAPWVRVPYPMQWGMIRFELGMFLGFMAGTLASVIESVGDYYACARISQCQAPKTHAVNRGILMEGVGCLIAAFFGPGLSLTSYSEVTGVIGITKVASRRALQAAGLLMMIAGVFSKIGGLVATLPDPLVGGVLFISIAMVGGVGLSSLQMIDMKLSRNMAVLGAAIMCGVMVPGYVKTHPEKFIIGDGSPSIGQELMTALKILLQVDMFIAGLTGFLLDNTIPGASRRQRGLIHEHPDTNKAEELLDPYKYPPYVNRFLSKLPLIQYIPFMPPVKQDKRSDSLRL